MEKYNRGLEASRANNNYDLSKFAVIEDLIKRGDNPVGAEFISSACTSTITAKDVFNFFRWKKRDFDLTISGGNING